MMILATDRPSDNPPPLALWVAALRERLNTALLGKASVIELVLAGVLARGHLLFEDLPGLGKTTLAKAIATAIGGRFARVQCTPDLLPGDVTGFNVFNQQTRLFEFLPGPVFADVLLADEINRATPRAQSALLEAMAERQVTVDNHRHRLAETFLVIATQNPVEHHGTNPLPEAQLDRFAMKLRIGYPGRFHEDAMLAAAVAAPAQTTGLAESGAPVLPPGGLAELQAAVAAVTVAPPVRGYLLDLTTATRQHPRLTLGVSPRGLLTWQRTAQAWAFLHERHFTTPDDVAAVARPVLSVRLGLDPDAPADILEQILATVPVPAFVPPPSPAESPAPAA